MTPEPNFDALAERLRQRIAEPGDDYEPDLLCPECETGITPVDLSAGYCTNCGFEFEESK